MEHNKFQCWPFRGPLSFKAREQNMFKCTENLKSFRAREQNMFEWRQEPCQFRDVTDKVSLPKVTRNQTKPLLLKRKHTRKNRHASGLNENGSISDTPTWRFPNRMCKTKGI